MTILSSLAIQMSSVACITPTDSHPVGSQTLLSPWRYIYLHFRALYQASFIGLPISEIKFIPEQEHRRLLTVGI
ncbi:hypothetical protein EDD85DRAFT_128537 [Armillaria nabsnona]|nr:hypothetical protein EDD85DRAFT_128537 [Armillaria nabsnona]